MSSLTKHNVILYFASISVACALSAPILLTSKAFAAETAPATCSQEISAVIPQLPGGPTEAQVNKIVLISLASSAVTLGVIGFLATRRNSTLFPPLA